MVTKGLLLFLGIDDEDVDLGAVVVLLKGAVVVLFKDDVKVLVLGILVALTFDEAVEKPELYEVLDVDVGAVLDDTVVFGVSIFDPFTLPSKLKIFSINFIKPLKGAVANFIASCTILGNLLNAFLAKSIAPLNTFPIKLVKGEKKFCINSPAFLNASPIWSLNLNIRTPKPIIAAGIAAPAKRGAKAAKAPLTAGKSKLKEVIIFPMTAPNLTAAIALKEITIVANKGTTTPIVGKSNAKATLIALTGPGKAANL